MLLNVADRPSPCLDDFVAAFEFAQEGGRKEPLTAFLPGREHPLYRLVLPELIRVEMEYAWRRAQPKHLQEYQEAFPELFQAKEALAAIAFEEYRLRRQAGEKPSLQEYRQHFGIDTSTWPNPDSFCASNSQERASESCECSDSARQRAGLGGSGIAQAWSVSLDAAARAYQRFYTNHGDANDQSFENWCQGLDVERVPVQFFTQAHFSNPRAAARLAEALTTFPDIGTEFLGFRLIDELGRGAFGRVYLAEQSELAGRFVALKVATDILGESQTLAQLQHTNIVPIYSMHRTGPFQAVCMPYFGATTLADVLRQVEQEESIPISGKVLVSTLNDRKGSTRLPVDSSAPYLEPTTRLQNEAPATPPQVTQASGKGDGAIITLNMLERFSYVEAILWIAARLADGLAHAHERGILHRDLKPANVLLTDEGQPMLLDFNLATDTKTNALPAAASIGGTLPYMSPEHLRAFRGSSAPVDGRSDVYSLGVILYELLAGKHPFRSYGGLTSEILDDMIQDRLDPATPLQTRNPAVSPAVASIVHRCLAAEPTKRYQNARHLQEDLERHLQNLSLKHAPEPSLTERSRKFLRRHPALTSLTSMAVVAAVVIAALTAGFVVRGQSVARQEALDSLNGLQDNLRNAQTLLSSREIEKEQLHEGIEECRAGLKRFNVLDNPDWRNSRAVRYLSDVDQAKLRAEAGELLLLLAHATSQIAGYESKPSDRNDQIQVALGYAELAETRAGKGMMSRAHWMQQAELADLLGNFKEAKRLRDAAAETPIRTVRDLYLTAHALAKDGEFREALPLLIEATQRDPQNFPAWSVRGNCHDALAQDADALAAYAACIALRPQSPWPWYNRGLCYLRQKHYERSSADFDRAIALRPDLADAFINRALAKEGLADFPGAIRDLSQALELGTPRTRVYFMRAYAREKALDLEGAKDDMEKGLLLMPADEKSWIARGEARMGDNPFGALTDFDKALEINPRSIDALQDKAHVLGEKLGRDEDAVRVLNKAVSLNPDFVLARAGRGVHLARLGKRAAALADAEEAVLLDGRPPNLYQVACIYALTSRQNPADRFRAFSLLAAALRSGYGLDIVDQDTDLDPIRNEPEFRRAVEAAHKLQEQPAHKATNRG